MNFDFSDEQKMLREQVRHLLRDKVSYSGLRKMHDAGALFDRALWKEAAHMGLQGAAVPEIYGGVGLGELDLCVIAEEIGRAVAPLPFSSSVFLATEAIKLAGSEEQRQRYLPGLATGEKVGTFALAEGPFCGRAVDITTRCEDGRLTGTKLPVPDATDADIAVIAARTAAGNIVLTVLALKADGVRVEPVSSFDPFRPLARLVLNNAEAEVLGSEQNGEDALARLLDRAAVYTAFEQIGGADASLEMARDYALERLVFGRPIAAFQAIKHKLADMLAKNEIARSNAWYAGWALESAPEELPLAAAAARISATEAYEFASRENLHVHGGIGYTWEADAHFHYRRARLLALSLGPVGTWSERLMNALEQRQQIA
ncbi:MAG: acyl-CoA/acyl-ACP dehydrogenase [Alphaproteobacteria bacterium]|nr:acyl-CoA/acyl-ACP dehydrogenase [Alphaproteobacteria bacterium]